MPNPEFMLNDNIECLANLCQCYDYLAEYQDPNAGETLAYIEKQLEQLSDLAFQKLLFPRIVNYIKTYSHHTAQTYVPFSMVFKTILNTTSQVPICHLNRVVLNRVLDGIHKVSYCGN